MKPGDFRTDVRHRDVFLLLGPSRQSATTPGFAALVVVEGDDGWYKPGEVVDFGAGWLEVHTEERSCP